MLKKALILVGLGMIVYASFNLYRGYSASRTKPVYSEPAPTIQLQPTPTAVQPTLEQPVIEPTALVPTLPAPTTGPLFVQGYTLTDGVVTISLSDGATTAFSIVLTDKEIAGTWASAIAYQESDHDCLLEDGTPCVFAPKKGTMYSMIGDTTFVEGHSGQTGYKPILALSNLENSVRVTDQGDVRNVSQGQEQVAGFVGKRAYFCQSKGQTPLTAYYTQWGCPGVRLELEIVAAELVLHENVPAYNANLLNLQGWLSSQNSDFLFLHSGDSIILVTCIGKFDGQPEDGEPAVHNRMALGLKIVRPGE